MVKERIDGRRMMKLECLAEPEPRRVATLLCCAILAISCSNIGPKAVVGAATGAAAGGLIGAAAGGGAEGIAAGVLLGGLAGGAIGDALDQRDRELASQSNQYALESNRAGQAATWQNPDSGHSGSITPTRTYQTGQGQFCREYQQSVVVGGESQEAYGTACRQPDGSWRVVQ
jgi:surface antigen